MIPAGFFPASVQSRFQAQGLWLPEPAPKQVLSEEQAIKLAIQEAYRGLGSVSPNPLVGCVILNSQNQFLSKGYHARYGEAHAEVNALKGLSSEELKGAKVFVTLEPCAHEGKTPSCAKALAKLPIAEVIYGLEDPNPLVKGQGASIIHAAGIQARVFSGLQNELEEVCEHFLWNFRHKKVFVSAKVASSLDGQLALASGESKWITDETSRKIAHVLRAGHDAMLVGSNTISTDDPSLNIRSEHFPNLKKKLIILDSDAFVLSRAEQLQLSKVHKPEDVYFVISDQISNPPNAWGAQIIRLPSKGLGLDLNVLLTKLWDLGLRSILIEGGAHVLSSFITEKAIQRLYLFQAPIILGAKGSKGWTEQVSIETMSHRMALRNRQFIPLEKDLLITGLLN
jgi:diaminohydroxyphosphoribosylaminopyrimidine deaminase/5-amino-6-(5-phosphoribosylamino)uracil reductase